MQTSKKKALDKREVDAKIPMGKKESKSGIKKKANKMEK